MTEKPVELEKFFDWWSGLPKRGHLVPSAHAFEKIPEAFEQHSFILRREDGGNFKMVEVGEAVEKMSDVRLHGLMYLGLFNLENSAALGAYLADVCGWPCGLDCTRIIETEARMRRRIRHILLPMAGYDRIIRYIAGISELLSEEECSKIVARTNRFEEVRFIDIGAGAPQRQAAIL